MIKLKSYSSRSRKTTFIGWKWRWI